MKIIISDVSSANFDSRSFDKIDQDGSLVIEESMGVEINSIKPSPKNTNFSGGYVRVHGVSHPGYINVNKQRKHIPGSPEYTEGKSIWSGTVDDAINLFNRLAGRGTRVSDAKERISTSNTLGLYVQSDGTARLTKNAIIHYSSTGAHIVPTAP